MLSAQRQAHLGHASCPCHVPAASGSAHAAWLSTSQPRLPSSFTHAWRTRRAAGGACRASAAKIASKQSGAGTGSSADPEYEGLQKWAQAAGIEARKFRPAEFAGLRGMAARESIGAGEVLASVPVAAALVVSPKERCGLPRSFCDAAFYSKQPWYVQMALKLLHERRLGAVSRLAPYVAALPASFSTPLTWTEAELDALEYPHLQQQVRSQQEGLRKLASELAAATPGTPVTEADLAWALQAVRSRAFSGPYAGPQWKSRAKTVGAIGALAAASVVFAHLPVEQVLNGAIAAALFNILYDVVLSQKVKWYAMCPIIDFINHSSSVQSEVEFEYFSDRFSVRCQTAFGKGEQVFISYGRQGNDLLLQFYGFVEPGSPHDTFVVPDLSQSAPRMPSLAALQQLPKALLDRQTEVVLTRKGPDSRTVERLREGGLTDGQIIQLVRRISEAELEPLNREPATDHDMARAFRKEKAAVLCALLAKS